MSSRIGRPTDNPKNNKITVRLDEKSTRIMEKVIYTLGGVIAGN